MAYNYSYGLLLTILDLQVKVLWVVLRARLRIILQPAAFSRDVTYALWWIIASYNRGGPKRKFPGSYKKALKGRSQDPTRGPSKEVHR